MMIRANLLAATRVAASIAAVGVMLSASSAFALDGDLNGDSAVDGADTAIAQAALGTSVGDDGYVAAADHDGDGIISMQDLSLQLDLGS
jgi:hypothetical protein